jgi:hypothetical protein
MTFGSNHFVSIIKALKYYKVFGLTLKDVQKKIANKEICIGMPPYREGERFFADDDGRYHIIFDEQPTLRKNQEAC